MPGSVSTDVEAYLSAVPEKHRAAIEALRSDIRRLVSDADEVLSYKLPTFSQGRHIVAYGAFRNHCSLFPLNSHLVFDLADELAAWKCSPGTIQFTADNPLPPELIGRIVQMRLEENRRLGPKKA